MALKEVWRHYIGEKRDSVKAQKSLQTSLEYRRDAFNVHALRACFFRNVPFQNDQDKKTAVLYKRLIESDLRKQTMVVRGMDKQGRPVVLISNRTSQATETGAALEEAVEAYVLARLYVLERALAVAEVSSLGRTERVMAVIDFTNKTYPPVLAGVKRIATIFPYSHTERLQRMVVINPPLWGRAMYNVVYPFLAKETRDKFIVVSGEVSIFP